MNAIRHVITRETGAVILAIADIIMADAAKLPEFEVILF